MIIQEKNIRKKDNRLQRCLQNKTQPWLTKVTERDVLYTNEAFVNKKRTRNMKHVH